jgi:hypothetical protein
MDDLGCGRLVSTPSSRRDPAFFRVGICAPSTETRPRSRSVVPKGFPSRRRGRGWLERGQFNLCAHQLIGPSPTDVVAGAPVIAERDPAGPIGRRRDLGRTMCRHWRPGGRLAGVVGGWHAAMPTVRWHDVNYPGPDALTGGSILPVPPLPPSIGCAGSLTARIGRETSTRDAVEFTPEIDCNGGPTSDSWITHPGDIPTGSQYPAPGAQSFCSLRL